MQQYDAGVLIDTYGCRPDEIRTIAAALTLLQRVSLGDFGYLEKFLKVALVQELQGEPKIVKKLSDLLMQADRVLWKDRERLTVYEPRRASTMTVLAYGLERRLACDTNEAEEARKHMLMERKYHL